MMENHAIHAPCGVDYGKKMLIIRNYLEEWRNLPEETKYDLLSAMELLPALQKFIVVCYVWGYTPQEINRIVARYLFLEVESTEYLNSAITALAINTGYSDYNVLKTAKGEVKKKWVDKCTQIAQTW